MSYGAKRRRRNVSVSPVAGNRDVHAQPDINADCRDIMDASHQASVDSFHLGAGDLYHAFDHRQGGFNVATKFRGGIADRLHRIDLQ